MDADVKLCILETLLKVESDDRGNLRVRGARQDVAEMAERYLHKNSVRRGHTLQHRLKAADTIAKEFVGEVVGRSEVVQALRSGWIELLSENLMSDLDKGNEHFQNWFGIHVRVEAEHRRPASCGGPYYWAGFDVSQPDFLVISRAQEGAGAAAARRSWKVKWEEITRMVFTYSEPRPAWLPRAPVCT